MKSLKELIMEDRPHLSEGSVRTYLANLKKIGINESTDIEKLDEPDYVFNIIADMKLNMKRNIVSSVLIIITASGGRKDLYEIYRQRLFDLGKEYNAEMAKNEKTETQEKNWVTIEELKKITKRLLRENPKSQNSLIASLYTLQNPTRLDYYDMEIVGPKAEIGDEKNYLVIHNTRRKEFVFNDFKTKNKYNQVIIKVSKELNRVINKFLKLNPDRKYLLQQTRSEKPLTRNALGKLIPFIFKDTGKNVTLNIIRHVFVSEQVDLAAVKKFQEIASSMMHSSAEQMSYNKGCD
tara:strand:+ start:307 stop:1185 length:879 start_codon:yes stop_codon:yes gene_type:complete